MNRWRKKNGRFDRHLNGRAEKYGWKMERWISYHGWMQGWIAAEGNGMARWMDGQKDGLMNEWMKCIRHSDRSFSLWSYMQEYIFVF